MLVLTGLVDLHRIIQLQLFRITGWGIDLDFHDIEWFALEMNRDHSVIFFVCLFVCFLYPSTAVWTLVDYDGYSISSKGFLPTVVDIMVIKSLI